MSPLNITVNGTRYELLVENHETLSSVLRERLNLTGTKIGCSQGSCGACTVLVDNEPVLSCISPALRFDGSDVLTIEGVRKNGVLHDLQQKLVEHGAIQCGFCTPGMVITALDFVNKNPNPTIAEIKDAISGNVCRCTGYKKIISAIAEYAQEKYRDKKKTIPVSERSGPIVGTSRPYIEATKKVQGTAEYTDDIRRKNTLYAKFLRSTYPHAHILDIDYSEALKLPGVRAIATGKDIPIHFGVLPISQDETAMAIEKTRYAGEVVAAVAADTEDIAKEALKLIKVKYEPIRAFLTIDDSLEDSGTDERIHNHSKFNNNIHKKSGTAFRRSAGRIK